MEKLWQKSDINKSEAAKFVEGFTVGNDFILDQRILPYDVQASIAHAKGLEKSGYLSKEELQTLEQGLLEILAKWEKGEFEILPEQEDVHTAIEHYLTVHCGESGKKIHTGRSRNDQVLTAMRLYEKAELAKSIDLVSNLAKTLIDFAQTNEWVPMPGYTHMQPAMLSSVGMWAASFAELLIAQIESLQLVSEKIDYSPLGSAAGYGVNLDLDRSYVSDLLGFKAPMQIAMTAQSSRGKWEADIVHALSSSGAILAQMATDLLLYSNREYDFFEVDETMTTGSSIMPQKKNLDIAELIRGKYSILVGAEAQLKQLTSNLGSGYHRDLQLSKEPVINSFKTLKGMIEAATLLIQSIKPKQASLEQKCYAEILATNKANELVQQGVPFREAYKQVGNNLDLISADNVDWVAELKKSTHIGSTGNLGLDGLNYRLMTLME